MEQVQPVSGVAEAGQTPRPARTVAHVMTSALTLSFLQLHLAELEKTEVDYHLLANFDGTRFDPDAKPGYHNISLSRSLLRPKDLLALFRLIARLRRIRPDLVICSTPKGGLFGALAALIACPRTPRLFLVRGYRFPTLTGLRRRLVRAMETLPAYLCTEVHCTSKQTAETMAELIGEKRKKKIHVVLNGTANGIDTRAVFSPDAPGISPREEVRARFGLSMDAPLVIYVGRVCVDKGMEEFSAALETVKAQRPDTQVLVVGEDDPSDPLPAQAQTRLDALAIRAGRIENTALPEVVAAADLLVFPSRREGFGIAAIEAAAMGTPTLAARVGGLQSAVAEGVSGAFFEPQNADHLAEQMIDLLADPDRLSQLRQTSRRHAVENFDKALYDRYWLDIYRDER